MIKLSNHGAAHCFNFMIIAAAIFLLVKIVMIASRKAQAAEAAAPAPEPVPDPQVVLLTEIRDALRTKG